MRTNSDRYTLIYPPWAEYSFAWSELPQRFLSLKDYERSEQEIASLAEIGYTVAKDDHRFFSGPNGGGIIEIRRDLSRWFPAVMLRTEADLRNPPGSSRAEPQPYYALVPKLTPEHKLRLLPIPKAPSPLFSIEPIKGKRWFVAAGMQKETMADPIQLSGFPTLDVGALPLKEAPSEVLEALGKIEDRKRTAKWFKALAYHWWEIRPGTVDRDPLLLLTCIFYMGLQGAQLHSNSFRLMHIFAPELPNGAPCLSATKWHQAAAIIRYSTDW